VIGGCIKLHNEELPNLYSLPSIIRKSKFKKYGMGRARSTNGEYDANRILVGKPEGKKD
jgi:hypothetical protein